MVILGSIICTDANKTLILPNVFAAAYNNILFKAAGIQCIPEVHKLVSLVRDHS